MKAMPSGVLSVSLFEERYMIVVDNDVISYFWLEAGRTDAARDARSRDPDWHAPRLWRSEFRNVLYQHMADRDLSLVGALRLAEVAEADL